jgi:hypothetical protein
MKIKFYINIGTDTEPNLKEILPEESKPKTRAQDKALHIKYGMKPKDYDKKYPK